MQLTTQQRQLLLQTARRAIETNLTGEKQYTPPNVDSVLQEPRGAFVSIHKHGQLRGCIGMITAKEPLFLTVREMAIAAATQDFRFTPLDAGELPEIEIEISVLTLPVTITRIDEITLGVHGVIVEGGTRHCGVFLPQVATQTGWSKEEFLSHLCAEKAGLPPDAWKKPATTIKIFSAEVFSEKEESKR